MGDAAGEEAERFELLGIEEFALEGEAVGLGVFLSRDVDSEAFEELDFSLGGVDAVGAGEDPFYGAVAVEEAVFDFDGAAFVEGGAGVVGDAFEVVGMGEGGEGDDAGAEVDGVIAGEVEGAWADVKGDELILEVMAAIDEAGERVHEIIQATLAFDELGGAFEDFVFD